MKVYRIYLKQTKHWREFGRDYPSRESAEKVASRYRQDFPREHYIVRGGNFDRISTLVQRRRRRAAKAKLVPLERNPFYDNVQWRHTR